MKIVQPLKIHGGKRYLVKQIVSLMPNHLHYVEPFFGGGAVLLAKDPESVSEVVNDLNYDLTNFWKVLQKESDFAEFKRLVGTIPFSELEWKEAKNRHAFRSPTDLVGVHCAVDFFIICRQSLSGRTREFTSITKTRVRRGMNNEVSAWWSCIDGLDAVYHRLRRVIILNAQPAIKVIQNHDTPSTLGYLDPPYLHETRKSTKAYGQYEMSDKDHEDLLDTICQCRGKIMISGYQSKMYDVKLREWNRHSFDLPNNSAMGKKKERREEILWKNF